jgi:hypothetical protein
VTLACIDDAESSIGWMMRDEHRAHLAMLRRQCEPTTQRGTGLASPSPVVSPRRLAPQRSGSGTDDTPLLMIAPVSVTAWCNQDTDVLWEDAMMQVPFTPVSSSCSQLCHVHRLALLRSCHA